MTLEDSSLTKMESTTCPFCGRTARVAVPSTAYKVFARPDKEGGDGQWIGCSGCGSNYWVHVWIDGSESTGRVTREESATCPFCGNTQTVTIPAKTQKLLARPAKEGGDGQWVGCRGCRQSYWLHVWI